MCSFGGVPQRGLVSVSQEPRGNGFGTVVSISSQLNLNLLNTMLLSHPCSRMCILNIRKQKNIDAIVTRYKEVDNKWVKGGVR